MNRSDRRSQQIGLVDAALERLQRARDEVLAQPAGVRRCLLLAELADDEAACWAELSEHSRTRVHWRAALAAREYARHTARCWRQHAAHQAGNPAPGTAFTAAAPLPAAGGA